MRETQEGPKEKSLAQSGNRTRKLCGRTALAGRADGGGREPGRLSSPRPARALGQGLGEAPGPGFGWPTRASPERGDDKWELQNCPRPKHLDTDNVCSTDDFFSPPNFRSAHVLFLSPFNFQMSMALPIRTRPSFSQSVSPIRKLP